MPARWRTWRNPWLRPPRTWTGAQRRSRAALASWKPCAGVFRQHRAQRSAGAIPGAPRLQHGERAAPAFRRDPSRRQRSQLSTDGLAGGFCGSLAGLRRSGGGISEAGTGVRGGGGPRRSALRNCLLQSRGTGRSTFFVTHCLQATDTATATTTRKSAQSPAWWRPFGIWCASNRAWD